MKKLILVLLLPFTLWCTRSMAQDAEGQALGHYTKAETYRKNKRFIEAIEELDKAINLDKSNFRFYFTKAICYFNIKDADNTINTLNEAINIKKDYVPAYTLMAQSYKTKKQSDKVVIALDNAFKYETDNTKKLGYKNEIITILVRNKEFAKAKPHISQAKTLSPSDETVLFMEGKVANELGDHKTAKESLNLLVKNLTSRDPKATAKFYYELGYAYYKLNEYDNAQEVWKNADFGYFRPLIARYNPKVYFANAVCYFKIYDYAKAKENLEVALKMQTNYAQAYMLMAEIARKEVKQDMAITFYTKALAIENEPPRRAEILKALANNFMESQKFSDVVSACVQYLKITPNDYNVIFLQAMANYRLKNYGEAINILEALAANQGIDPESKAQFNFALAVCYKAANQLEKAKVAFKRAETGSFARTANLELLLMSGDEKEEEAADDDKLIGGLAISD